MAYKVKGKNGVPLKKEGKDVLGTFLTEVKISELNEEDMSFLTVASTEGEDRDKDIVRVSGWDLKNFKKNPVVPWSHNYYNPPIALAKQIKVDKDSKRLIFRPKFDENDEFAKMIFNKYMNGFLKTFSVGFIGNEFSFRDEEDRWYGGREFFRQELLEISCCTIPSNPEANVDLLDFGGGNKNCPDNLVQLGYSQFFAEKENGLYFPVKDVELYANPTEIVICNGVKGICANLLSDVVMDEGGIYSDSNPVIVAYLLDNKNVFDEKTANEWVRKNAETKQKICYIDLKCNDDGSIELRDVVEDINVDLGIAEMKEESQEEDLGEDISKGESQEEENVENSDSEDKVNNNVEEPSMVMLNIDDLEKMIDLAMKKILVSLENKGDNNKENNEENTSEEKDGDTSENYGFYDLTELLSPDNSGEGNKDIVEIDENTIRNLLDDSEIKAATKSSVKGIVGKIFKETISELSGKIS